MSGLPRNEDRALMVEVVSYPFWRGQGIAPIFLGISEGKGEGVGGVRRGRFWQREEALDHFGDGGFLRRAVANDGLLHFSRSDFVNFKARFGDRSQGGSPSFAHDESGLEILGVKQAFDDTDGRLVLFEDVAQGLDDFYEAAGMFPSGGTGDGSVREGSRSWVHQPNDAITGAAKGRVEAEHDLLPRVGSASNGREYRRRSAPGAAKALLHLLKLLRRNAHCQNSANSSCE